MGINLVSVGTSSVSVPVLSKTMVSTCFQLTYYVGDSGLFLAHSNVDTLNAGAFLVDDGIDGDGCLSCLSISDDQLSLSSTNGH